MSLTVNLYYDVSVTCHITPNYYTYGMVLHIHVTQFAIYVDPGPPYFVLTVTQPPARLNLINNLASAGDVKGMAINSFPTKIIIIKLINQVIC